jgi:hypothetical protein
MPSDPAGAQPTGVLVRPAPDFFDDHLCYGGAMFQTNPPSGLNYASISLFNNATSGILLKVYGVSLGNDDQGSGFAYALQGAPLGTLQGACTNVRFDQGAPYGQIYMLDSVVGAIDDLYPLPLPAAPMVLGAPDAGGAAIISPFPLFIVPVGWSLVIANITTCSTIYAGFWYQQANE